MGSFEYISILRDLTYAMHSLLANCRLAVPEKSQCNVLDAYLGEEE